MIISRSEYEFRLMRARDDARAIAIKEFNINALEGEIGKLREEVGGLIKALRRLDDIVVGHWIRNEKQTKSYARVCSACGETAYFCGNGDYPYCPYCKAHMRKRGAPQ